MSLDGDEIVKGLFGVVLAGVASAVTWLASLVLKNKDAALVAGAKYEALDSRVGDLEARVLTTEDVRMVIEAALERRDVQFKERRSEWDRRLALEIKSAVSDGISQCPYVGSQHKHREL